MGTISYGGKTAAVEAQFMRVIDVSAADFEPNVSITAAQLDIDGRNWFADGFYIMPAITGDVSVIPYQDWIRNEKSSVGLTPVIIPGLAGGIIHAIRVVKVFTAGTTVGSIVAAR